MGKKKGNKSGLGRALANAKNNQKKQSIGKHVTEITEKPKLISITERTDLNEFVTMAQMTNKKFEAERERDLKSINEVQIVDPTQTEAKFLANFYSKSVKNPEYKSLKIPRKPKWYKGMNTTEFKALENDAFLEWRKNIAETEESNLKLSITPFEKNLEIWRQLWIVVEKSDLILQILDGRNPLFFYCDDLEKYIKEINPKKESVLLINKSDLVPEEARAHWAAYFTQNGYKYIFFSAKQSQQIIDEMGEPHAKKGEGHIYTQQYPKGEETKENIDAHVCSSSELLNKLKEYSVRMSSVESKRIEEGNKFSIGMIGFPNVGKSSVINVLLGKKKVGVAAQPGKTKHFQTLMLGDMRLCDCPGLVFPSMANSKSELVCGGILPIDQLREFNSPIALLMQRIPRELLTAFYKIEIPEEYTGRMFLQILAKSRGASTGSGNPDESSMAKRVLKDYTSGRLSYTHLCPTYDLALHGYVPQSILDLVPSVHDGPALQHLEETKQACGSTLRLSDLHPHTTHSKQEKNLDEAFFGQIIGERGIQQEDEIVKLTKEQKRAIKFAEKRGEDITEIDLDKLPVKSKKKHTQVHGKSNQNKPGFVKAADKFDGYELE